jgi:hypothetical protein
VAVQSRLPCYVHDPAYHEDQRGLSVAAAVNACEAAGAELGCAIAKDLIRCPRRREEAEQLERRESFGSNLRTAGVPSREIGILSGVGTPRLKRLAPMVEAMRVAALKRRPAIAVFNGDFGQGKTVAACYLLGRFGGMYCVAADIIRVGFDLDAAKAARVLVIDQLGFENLSRNTWGLGEIIDLLDARYRREVLTVLCSNMARSTFDERYGAVVSDRVRGDGEWHQFTGPSHRGVPG